MSAKATAGFQYGKIQGEGFLEVRVNQVKGEVAVRALVLSDLQVCSLRAAAGSGLQVHPISGLRLAVLVGAPHLRTAAAFCSKDECLCHQNSIRH